MADKNTVQFQYAFIEGTDIIVDISAMSDEERHSHTYICPGCGKELIPALGPKIVHHFKHKDGKVCNHDDYLHKLAELVFEQRFNCDMPLNIALPQIVKCSEAANNCILYMPGYLPEDEYNTLEFNNACRFRTLSKCNLKDYYDICIKEKGISNYIADLLLKDSTGKKEPLLIEILVTHKCTDDKKNSGLRIFEIPIHNEQDAFNLMTADCIHGIAYNFQLPVKTQKLNVNNELNRFVLYSDGKSYQRPVQTKCTEFPEDNHKTKVLEFYTLFPQTEDKNYKKAQELGYKVRNCHLCLYYSHKNFDGYSCSINYKEGTPYKPRTIFANACKNFCPLYRIKSSEVLKVTYQESDSTRKDCMSVYKRKYRDDVFKSIDEFISFFNAKKLYFKKLEFKEPYLLNTHFDTVSRILDDNNLIYGIEFTSTEKKSRILRIIFVRRNEFIHDINSKIRTIYAYPEVIERSDNYVCVFESEEYFFSNFVNFRAIQKVVQDERPFEIEDRNKTLEETESAEQKAARLSAVRQKLEYAKNSFKSLFDEGKLMLAEIGQLPYDLNSVYPICEDSSCPDALYFALIFKRPKSYRADEITIRFVDKKINNPGNDPEAKRIIIYIDKLGENVLEENCIYFKAGKIEYFNF